MVGTTGILQSTVRDLAQQTCTGDLTLEFFFQPDPHIFSDLHLDVVAMASLNDRICYRKRRRDGISVRRWTSASEI